MRQIARATPSAWRPQLVLSVVLAACIVVLGAVAVRLGADGNGDLRNYHYYGGWALLHKPVGFDLAPAQLQTYHHPLLDALYYLLSAALNRHPLLFTFVWSIPQSVSVWLALLIARRCLPQAWSMAPLLAGVAMLIGAFGATSIGVIGTSMSEGIPNAMLLWALLLVLQGDAAARSGGRSAGRYAGAGLLAGAGAVLKLTTAPYLLAFGAAIPAVMLLEPGVPRWRAALAFGAGVLLALAAIGVPWWIAVARAFGNPLFPYYNALFHSPYYPDENFFDRRFLPQTPLEWLLYPLEWAWHRSTRTSEQPVRDARVLAETLAAIGLVGLTLARRFPMRLRGHPGGSLSPEAVSDAFLAVYVLAAYALWLKTFAILRYASGLETLSGVVIVAFLCGLLRRPGPAMAASVAALVLLSALTVVPTWERRPQPGKRLVATDLPALPPDSTVLLFGPFEKAFLAPFAAPSVRFIGVDNNLVTLARRIGLEDLIDAALASATGPIWDLTDDATGADVEAAWLAHLHLRRTEDCRRVTATIAPVMTLCRLARAP